MKINMNKKRKEEIIKKYNELLQDVKTNYPDKPLKTFKTSIFK